MAVVGTPLEGLSILVVEDDYLVALALSALLEIAGAIVVGPVAWAQDALALLDVDEHYIDVAILDIDLNGEKSYAVADELTLREIRFIFATGYGVDSIDIAYRHHPRCQKPFDHQTLFNTLALGGR